MIIFLYAAVLLYAAIYDIRYHIVQDRIHIIILIMGFLYRAGSCSEWILGILFAFAALLMLLMLSSKRAFIGGGDIKFIFSNMIFLGIQRACIGTMLACVLLIAFNLGKKRRIPMLPYLSAGYLSALLWLA